MVIKDFKIIFNSLLFDVKQRRVFEKIICVNTSCGF